ncbi:sigma-70 family RNA polymerase sigma factor [Variovorax sp.]|uniref:RNA polymerase sigma factor n=1 Tax=Variovorax sp. TaxID=1871043 RepID=UPI00137E7B43|nr:sigma-70 family RNA polymerase sigma factor [Variovorax sp.]KAF1072396.1 MAG: hypothetical protein GAK39_00554 [Variovorax sp.]
MDFGIHHAEPACAFEADLAAGRGDEAEPGIALRDFLARNYLHLHRRLQRHLGCPDRASDCLHDAWLRLDDTPAAVQSPEAYVYRVACNLAVDRMRAERPWRQVADAEVALACLVDPAPGPESVAEDRATLKAVQRAMQRLPPRHQDILVALRVCELTRDEVATRHGLSLRRVDTALRQALRSCAEAAGTSLC